MSRDVMALAVAGGLVVLALASKPTRTPADPSTDTLDGLISNADLSADDWTEIGEAVAALQLKINNSL